MRPPRARGPLLSGAVFPQQRGEAPGAGTGRAAGQCPAAPAPQARVPGLCPETDPGPRLVCVAKGAGARVAPERVSVPHRGRLRQARPPSSAGKVGAAVGPRGWLGEEDAPAGGRQRLRSARRPAPSGSEDASTWRTTSLHLPLCPAGPAPAGSPLGTLPPGPRAALPPALRPAGSCPPVSRHGRWRPKVRGTLPVRLPVRLPVGRRCVWFRRVSESGERSGSPPSRSSAFYGVRGLCLREGFWSRELTLGSAGCSLTGKMQLPYTTRVSAVQAHARGRRCASEGHAH